MTKENLICNHVYNYFRYVLYSNGCDGQIDERGATLFRDMDSNFRVFVLCFHLCIVIVFLYPCVRNFSISLHAYPIITCI